MNASRPPPTIPAFSFRFIYASLPHLNTATKIVSPSRTRTCPRPQDFDGISRLEFQEFIPPVANGARWSQLTNHKFIISNYHTVTNNLLLCIISHFYLRQFLVKIDIEIRRTATADDPDKTDEVEL
jgi:hypothetical protein